MYKYKICVIGSVLFLIISRYILFTQFSFFPFLDECESNPCFHGGTCRNEINKYKCLCPNGFSGDFCEDIIDPCTGITCNSGNCIHDYRQAAPTCVCDPGYASGKNEHLYFVCVLHHLNVIKN